MLKHKKTTLDSSHLSPMSGIARLLIIPAVRAPAQPIAPGIFLKVDCYNFPSKSDEIKHKK